MSLGIVFKGPEGIVLAADSRVTLTAEMPKNNNETVILPSTFDNATKLLRFNDKAYGFVGSVTYGAGAIGIAAPRTAHSFLPEFENTLKEKHNDKRLSVKEFSNELSDFFLKQWNADMPKRYSGPDMVFLIGGYDEKAPYGRVFEVKIPSKPKPKEWHRGKGLFGPVWGGQLEYTSRLIHGYDPNLLRLTKEYLDLSDEEISGFEKHLRKNLFIRIPYQFLSLQDCVDLSIFLIRTTIMIQSFYVGVRGVGGSIDVATIRRTQKFNPVQQKEITGE